MEFHDGEEYLQQERAGKKKTSPVEWDIEANPHKDLDKSIASFEIMLTKEEKITVRFALWKLI